MGRSCILVTIGGKRIMFDCGMHMGYQDERRFPDFTYISREKDYTSMLDAVIITHLYAARPAAASWCPLTTRVLAAIWTTAARCRTSPKCVGASITRLGTALAMLTHNADRYDGPIYMTVRIAAGAASACRL